MDMFWATIHFMLKIDYRSYYVWHQTTLTKQPSFVMTQMESTLDHVVNKTTDTTKQ
jgi:hypothetical protein